MNRIVIAIFALALITHSAYAQQPSQPQPQSECGLTAATSPGVRGIRLGMSTEQLLALFPGSTKRRDFKETLERAKAAGSEETARLSFDATADGGGDAFSGVDSVSVVVYKGRVTEFTVSYAGPTWRNVDEWIGKLSESLKLPGVRKWAAGPSENPNKILKCNGVEIEGAIQGGGGSITVRNTVMGEHHHSNQGEEGKRREFKP
jgi:hypothetical protein